MTEENGGTPLKVAIIGAGFGGLGMAYALKQAGIEDFVMLEKSGGLGGTWRENTYPGCGCDVPSHLYSFSFEPHYPWSRRYAQQPEILAYQQHVARKYRLDAHIRYHSEVSEARYDEASALWLLQLKDGRRLRAGILISAVGQLHRPAYPNLPGRESFAGRSFHSAHWDHDFDLRGKTVAVIGTGASAVQFVPEIAPKVQTLKLFQRSPGWTFPKVEKRFSRFERWLLDTLPLLHDLDRLRVFFMTELLAAAYNGNRALAWLITAGSRLQAWWQIRDPQLRARLRPDFPIGCKRILLSNAWLPTLARDNVELIDSAIRRIEPEGVVDGEGRLHRVDAIIYGTGFAATQFLAPMRVLGSGGKSLHETWTRGAEAYLGMSVAGFPNFFMLYGPNTNVGSGSILFMLERQQRYLVQLLLERDKRRAASVEIQAQAQQAYVQEMEQRSAGTTYSGDCQSWYKTAEGRNTNNWVGSMLEFARRTRAPQLAHYRFQPRASTQGS
ncbi:Predicted flavoprotein CzcO associated with the cation diffusion facilitator CzcD [Solimonas aquatica]|uniref:Predicted flavoprotein CzcO associated with the cation diffusion facilitator CzcD n=1 Tax=Solimonas aquatica TaxID=489703 RepID=A0A1H9KG50_9GAMM|nr:NAD(P)/FAD-dependent oxidoreductase [Solimonas aquatica]SEQ97897.1 Predicted flavoprotein CzcO associated with the cation diffusion facilitator CzcD [Solimonas aquatica]